MAFDVEMPVVTSGIIYNITMQVEKQLLDEWLIWIQQEHIPAMMGTGCFIKHQLLKLMSSPENDDPTFAIQYFASTIFKFNQFESQYLDQLLKKISEKWNTGIVFYTTNLEIVN
ncbi:MAG: DUF4286 family protein [Chitinophagaceae bacterium]|jgi:hypothetical protein|nr:DUF4286 family protein [Chitinophagaceae bacterium]